MERHTRASKPQLHGWYAFGLIYLFIPFVGPAEFKATRLQISAHTHTPTDPYSFPLVSKPSVMRSLCGGTIYNYHIPDFNTGSIPDLAPYTVRGNSPTGANLEPDRCELVSHWCEPVARQV